MAFKSPAIYQREEAKRLARAAAKTAGKVVGFAASRTTFLAIGAAGGFVLGAVAMYKVRR